MSGPATGWERGGTAREAGVREAGAQGAGLRGAALRLALALALPTALAACVEPAVPAVNPPAPLLVDTVAVGALEDGPRAVRATGIVRARRETTLAFTTAGQVALIGVEEGDAVRAGQALAQLALDQVNAAAEAARAEAERAAAELARQRMLLGAGSSTRARVESAEAADRAAQARVSATAFDVGAARVVAPVDGVILRRHVERGQIVAAGSPVLTLGELSEGFVVRVPLVDSDVARIAAGQAATVRLRALQEGPLAGRVIEIGGRGDERTGTFEAKVSLPDGIAGLRSGQIASVEIAAAGAGAGAGAVGVPPLALFAVRAGEAFVYVVEGGQARARLVKVGGLGDRQAQVLDGLRPGERVVVSGVERLRDGMPVQEAGR